MKRTLVTAYLLVIVISLLFVSGCDEDDYRMHIIFAIDCSGSMLNSDPDGRRMEAASSFIETYINDERTEYNVILWSGLIKEHTGFTRDLEELEGALLRYSDGGTTDYQITLDQLYQDINYDIMLMPTEEKAYTGYKIIFLTDGLPDPSPNGEDYYEIYDSVNRISQLTENENIWKFEFNTFLLDAGMLDEALKSSLTDLLMNMATIGNGNYTEYSSAEEIDFVEDVKIP